MTVTTTTTTEQDSSAASHISNPIKRIRWATQRAGGASGQRKRHGIIERFHNRHSGSVEKKRASGDTPTLEGIQEEQEESEDGGDPDTAGRRIFFNQPLPDDAKNEDGYPITDFGRNKIRTAKYTPLSFIPKNLYWQFHQIANIYFFIIIILDVRSCLISRSDEMANPS